MDQMQEIAVAVFKEDQPISLILIWLGEELDRFGADIGECGIEVVDIDGEVPDTGGFERRGRRGTFAGNNFKQRAIRRFDEVVAAVLIVDVKAEMLDVPLRQIAWIGRRNRGVLQPFEHELRVYQGGLGG